MKEKILIKKASIDDLMELSILFDQYRVFYKKESQIEAAFEFLKNRIQSAEATIFIALVQSSNKIVGFTLLYPLFSSTRMKRLWLLNDLFVQSEFRGNGVSLMLIDAAKELVRETNACGMMLETAKTNHIGNALYPRTGFQLETDSNFYFWNSSAI